MAAAPRRRGWWIGPATAFAVIALVLAGGDPRGGGVKSRHRVLSGRVLEVTDGDTVVVRLDDGSVEDVRYIGINTPESTPNQPLECFGHEAAERNGELVAGRRVHLEVGPEPRDDYGRLLAWVHAGGVFVNASLVRGGYARTLTIAPNDARAPLFGRLEAAAGRRALGLWGACP